MDDYRKKAFEALRELAQQMAHKLEGESMELGARSKLFGLMGTAFVGEEVAESDQMIARRITAFFRTLSSTRGEEQREARSILAQIDKTLEDLIRIERSGAK